MIAIAKSFLTNSNKLQIDGELNERIIEWANLYATTETMKHDLLHNDNLKRKWIIKKCCKRDLRHRQSWPIFNFKDFIDPDFKDVREWAINNIKVSYVTMSPFSSFLEFQTFLYFKIDLFLDLAYVITTPMAVEWFSYVMWITIVIPYLIMALGSCTENKPANVRCLTFWAKVFNQEHLILQSHAIDRWVKYSENQILIIGLENIAQFGLQTVNSILIGHNVPMLAIISPFSSFIGLIYGIHSYFIALRIKGDKNFNTPMREEESLALRTAQAENKDCGNYTSVGACIQHFARILISIVAILSTLIFIIGITLALIVDQDFNPVWMNQVSDITQTGSFVQIP